MRELIIICWTWNRTLCARMCTDSISDRCGGIWGSRGLIPRLDLEQGISLSKASLKVWLASQDYGRHEKVHEISTVHIGDVIIVVWFCQQEGQLCSTLLQQPSLRSVEPWSPIAWSHVFSAPCTCTHRLFPTFTVNQSSICQGHTSQLLI